MKVVNIIIVLCLPLMIIPSNALSQSDLSSYKAKDAFESQLSWHMFCIERSKELKAWFGWVIDCGKPPKWLPIAERCDPKKRCPPIPPLYDWNRFCTLDVYGPRKNPVTGMRDFHDAIDIRAALGTPVYAGTDGIIHPERYGEVPVTGNLVIVVNPNIKIAFGYGHLDQILVQRGQNVTAGQLIGTVGNTGMSTEPHLHLTVAVADPKDPNNTIAKDPKFFFPNLHPCH
jgi:Peptidase family M23